MTWYELLAIIGSVVTAAVVVTWWAAVLYHRMAAQLDRLERQLGTVSGDVNSVRDSVAHTQSTLGVLIGRLGRRTSDKGNPVAWDGLSTEEAARLLSTMHGSTAAEALDALRPSGNPITAEELDRLRALYARTKDGDLLTYEEAHEFHDLARRVAEDDAYRHVPGRNSLLGIATFLLGYWQGLRGTEADETHEHSATT